MRPGEVAAKVAAVVAADLARGQEPCVFELDPGGHSHITNGEFDRAKCLWAYGVDRANARVRAAHWPATNETTLFRSQHVSVDEEIPMLVAPLECVVPSPDAAVWDACYAAYGEAQADVAAQQALALREVLRAERVGERNVRRGDGVLARHVVAERVDVRDAERVAALGDEQLERRRLRLCNVADKPRVEGCALALLRLAAVSFQTVRAIETKSN